MSREKHTVRGGVAYQEKGLPHSPRWFSDGRLSFQLNETSITAVEYRNPLQKRGNSVVFLEKLWSGFRPYLETERSTHRVDYANSKVWPFGVEAEWRVEGTTFGYRVFAVEEAIVLQLRTPDELSVPLRFKLEFYRDFGLIPEDEQDMRYASNGAKRCWRPWTFDAGANILRGGFDESGVERNHEMDGPNINALEIRYGDDSEDVPLHIGIGASFPLAFEQRPLHPKYILRGAEELEPGRTYNFYIAFAGDEEGLAAKSRRLAGEAGDAIERQLSRYEAIAARSPVLKSPYPALNDFFALAPLYHESCKVQDTPGAIKARNMTYWVWGWDGMTSNYSALYWGDADFLRDMLRFYEETADPELGIAHCYRNDMRLYSASAMPAQGMYIALLQQYYAVTGDLQTVKERYPFARTVYERIMRSEIGETGLCEGASLFPDFPMYMKETGQDISSLNNTILYGSARALDYLAGLVGDGETEQRARTAARRLEERFLPLFFDEQRGFIVSSVDSVTLERRDSFNANAVKWENGYCGELMADADRRALAFFEEHVVCKAGLREIPVWSDAYDMDSNQLHCWWPVTGEYYMRLINKLDRPDLIRQWIGWVSYWTGKLMCPEGIPCYVDTDEPELDRWNTTSGSWHAYSMRGWYQAAVHGVVGVGIEAGGLTFYPYSGEEMALEGIACLGRVYDIEMKGSGPFIASIEAGGVRLEGTHVLPSDIGTEGERVRVSVHRTTESPRSLALAIVRACGLELTNYRYEEGVLRASVRGAGTVRMLLRASASPTLMLNGVALEAVYDAGEGTATVTFAPQAGQIYEMEIRL